MSTTETATGATGEPVEEVWAYGGVRVDTSGKRQYAWLPDAGAGTVVYFAKFHADAVGELYRVRVSRDTDGPVSVYGQPRYAADGRLEPEVAAQLRAEHQTALTTLALARQERAAARHNELDELVEPLRVITAKLTRPQRTALIVWLITELTNPSPGRDRAGGERR